MNKNKVYLVGAGPGRIDLITVRGLNVLREADVVIYDYLLDKTLLKEAREDAQIISSGDLGKYRYSGNSSGAQKEINKLMVKKAKEGKRVVRLKNGDVSIFARSREELDALVKNKIEFEIIPGVTAMNTASAFTGIPLTDRLLSSSVVFLTGHESQGKNKAGLNWKAIATFKTIVVYMGVNNLHRIVAKLAASGKSRYTPVAIVHNAGSVNQKIAKGRLENIVGSVKKEGIKAPAIVIIGKIVALEKGFNWLEKNRRILFTGLSKERFFLEGTHFHIPLIKIGPLEDYGEFDHYIENIRDFNWIVFVSRYGVEYFFKRLTKIGYDSRALSGLKIAAIGNSTKDRLLDFGISADLVPEKESSKGLIEEFKKVNLKGRRIFLPRSDISGKGLEKEFKRLGAAVTASFAYTNTMPGDLPDLELGRFDEVMFTSPSTVRNFRKRYKSLPGNVKVSCIGDVTLEEAKRCRLLG